ncbi:MAG TPA: TlpA disulfide reductase family protein [Bacteroidales bacterium]|nr:TlpA disulfide reductase family protein [Bacteroidales bacterium]
MNKLLFGFVLISIICTQFGCRNKTEKTKAFSISYSVLDTNSIPIGEPTIIYGTIHNLDVYPDVREITLEIPDFKGYENKYTTLIAPDGSFYFKIYPIIAREIILKPVSDIIIVHPGDSLYIEKDFRDIIHARFNGNTDNLNNNVNKFLSDYYLGRYDRGYNLASDAYKKYCDDYRNESYTKLFTFISENNPSEEFRKWAKTTIDVDYYTALLGFFSESKISPAETAKRYNSFFSFLDSLEQNFNKSIICSDYYQLISNYQNFYMRMIATKHKRGVKDHKRDSLFIDELSSFSKNELLNQFVLSNHYNQFLNNHFLQMFEDNLYFVESKIKEPFLLKTLYDRYKYLKEYTINPSSLSDAMLGESDLKNESTGYKFNYPVRKDLINRIIRNNKNKVIYVDFWALWCPPCLPELYTSKKLMPKYEGQDIEFVFICLSDSSTAKQKINEIGIGGKHYFLNSDEFYYYQNKFGFQGIPHYLLIDKNGTIVDFGTILRPSFPGTIEKIDNLLNNKL